MKQYIKNTLGILTIALAASVAAAGEIEQFISETMAERRAQNAREAVKTEAKSEIQQIVLPESKLSAKTKSLKSRNYRYDKAGRLVSVVCEACPELNESYVYDKQGNILEKRVGNKAFTYKYDTANQLASMESAEGLREYVYDMAGRLIEEKFNGKTDVKYTYGYLDKVTEVNRRGNITKFVYDGVGMLASKISSDGKVENWMWDGLALIRRGKDIHVNEPHISGGVPIVSKTPNRTQFHESDFLGTTLWSIDTKGHVVSFQNDTIFGDGTIKTNRCARFTGKPYDEDLQAFVFPNRVYDPSIKRWRSMDPSGYPDGTNAQFYAVIPTIGIDPLGLKTYYIGGAGENTFGGPMQNVYCSNCGAFITGGAPYSWKQYNDIIADIEATKKANPDEPINLVGHSYGGDTAYLVARDTKYTVDNLVTLDPVSHFTYNISKPNNVSRWDNSYSNPKNYGVDDFIADIGGQWGPVDNPNVNNHSSSASHGDVSGLISVLPSSAKSVVHKCER